jgi:hypothetical protein
VRQSRHLVSILVTCFTRNYNAKLVTKTRQNKLFSEANKLRKIDPLTKETKGKKLFVTCKL